VRFGFFSRRSATCGEAKLVPAKVASPAVTVRAGCGGDGKFLLRRAKIRIKSIAVSDLETLYAKRELNPG
jgi:hypothetical protein